jgi:hypothetical protein
VKRGLIGTGEVHMTSLWVTLGTIAVVGLLGIVFFSRAEATAMDAL